VDKEMLPKAKGTIEFFHRAKAFGVIAGDDGESYYFYPHSFAERYKPKRGLWKPVMKKVVPGTPVEFYWNEGTNSKTYECIRKAWQITGTGGLSLKGQDMERGQTLIYENLHGLLQPDSTVRFIFETDEQKAKHIKNEKRYIDRKAQDDCHVKLGPKEKGNFSNLKKFNFSGLLGYESTIADLTIGDEGIPVMVDISRNNVKNQPYKVVSSLESFSRES